MYLSNQMGVNPDAAIFLAFFALYISIALSRSLSNCCRAAMLMFWSFLLLDALVCSIRSSSLVTCLVFASSVYRTRWFSLLFCMNDMDRFAILPLCLVHELLEVCWTLEEHPPLHQIWHCLEDHQSLDHHTCPIVAASFLFPSPYELLDYVVSFRSMVWLPWSAFDIQFQHVV